MLLFEIDPVKIPTEKQLLNFANYENIFPEISRVVWQYFNYSGMFTPWHDAIPVLYFPGFVKHLTKGIKFLVENDISLYSFGYLTLPLHKAEDWDRPTLLFSDTKHLSWLRKLKRILETRENLDYLAYFMVCYFQTQVHYFGKARLEVGQVVKKQDGSYTYDGYERLWVRILECTRVGADPLLWMQQKIEKFAKAYPKETMNFNCLINRNGLDPELETLVKRTSDPWREIKDFLGLSIDCEIVDGYVPKGWQPSGDDFEDRSKIARVTGDGFYYYGNNSQRRGKRHYASNTYYAIKCDPSNFQLFRGDWLDESLLMKNPTWEEYEKWAIYPERWDISGNATNGRGKSVKWRKG